MRAPSIEGAPGRDKRKRRRLRPESPSSSVGGKPELATAGFPPCRDAGRRAGKGAAGVRDGRLGGSFFRRQNR